MFANCNFTLTEKSSTRVPILKLPKEYAPITGVVHTYPSQDGRYSLSLYIDAYTEAEPKMGFFFYGGDNPYEWLLRQQITYICS